MVVKKKKKVFNANGGQSSQRRRCQLGSTRTLWSHPRERREARERVVNAFNRTWRRTSWVSKVSLSEEDLKKEPRGERKKKKKALTCRDEGWEHTRGRNTRLSGNALGNVVAGRAVWSVHVHDKNTDVAFGGRGHGGRGTPLQSLSGRRRLRPSVRPPSDKTRYARSALAV